MVHISAAIGQFFGAILKAMFLSAGAALAIGVLAAAAVVGSILLLRALLRRRR